MNDVIAEGSAGSYTQSWFPLATSDEVPVGGVVGRDFLDGRVAVFRGHSGKPAVVSAYCPHMGADLAQGVVEDDCLRCAFHGFRFDQSGECVATGNGDRVPPGSSAFAFPTAERYGLIWAFNGETPLFDLPDLGHPDDELVFGAIAHWEIECDPWLFMSNSFDFAHFTYVHGLELGAGLDQSTIVWTPFEISYTTTLDPDATPLELRIAIVGSNMYLDRWGAVDAQPTYTIYAGRPTRSGHHSGYSVVATPRNELATPAVAAILEDASATAYRITSEDVPILNAIRYRPAKLTKGDASLAKFLKHMRDYPRADPAGQLIR